MANRRQFLKYSALGIGGMTIGLGACKYIDDFTEIKNNPGALNVNLTRTPTYCEICFWQCAGWVYKTKDGQIWKIVGNDDDQHSNGRFCPRGTGGVGMYNDEDRLKTPLIRTGERGEFKFREASWDEALDLVAENMKKIAAEHGPECIALLTHGSGGKFFGETLKAFGSDNIAAPSYAQCRGPREVAFTNTFGEGVGSPERIDIRDTKCLVLIGSHLGENMHNGQVQEMSAAIDKGASIITVDPRFSVAAGKSKFWLPIKPATDLALLLSWIHVIIYEDWYDKEYVEKYTYGFEFLKEHVKTMTPEWAYGKTTIQPDIIRKTAKEMVNAAPSVIIHPGRHVTWYGDDTQRMRAVAILNAILGSWGRRGGYYNPSKISVPNYPHPEYPTPTKTWRDAFPGKYNLVDETLASGICDATIPSIDRACNFKMWLVNGTNLINTLPDNAKTLRAIENLDFIAVVDTMPMEIVSYADVVLPECTYLERYDTLRVSPHRKPSIALRMPAVEPKYNTKPAWWMAKQLAEKLGIGHYIPYNTIEEMLDWQLKEAGTSLEEMQKVGVKNYERDWDDLFFTENEDVEFFTNTGKIELYSTAFAQEGFDPMPNYTEHPQPPEGFYRLNYGRAPMHTFSRTANNPNLTDLMSENVLWVNPKVASLWGLKEAQPVWLINQDGIVSTFPIKVRVTERIRWDSVYMVHGFGHNQKQLTRAYGKGASDTQLISHVMEDPIMGGTGMRGNFVSFLTEKPEEAVL
ncbi:MAG: molybdopterin-dependent oxidoreductase [Bacteroidales bacterium]|nr:molybdopterin-dependent oxidoreductase [Bacteroidales bacterium]MCF8389219.1 molybdopterin-dependent oxidoreductase [Bacteroidales bacterium]